MTKHKIIKDSELFSIVGGYIGNPFNMCMYSGGGGGQSKGIHGQIKDQGTGRIFFTTDMHIGYDFNIC